MILTTAVCTAIALYHEGRSTTVNEQQLIAQTINNRATAENKPVCQIVFGSGYSFNRKFKVNTNFKNMAAVQSYYHIDDSSSFVTALMVASASTLPTSNAMYYHDHSIKHFAWDNGKLHVVAKTKNFTFYS